MKQGESQKVVFRRKLLAASVAACFAVSASQLSAQVLPTGATGVVGVTGISQAGSTLTVNTSGNSVLNYTSFSIGAGATVQINQASAAYASLQRVIGAGGVIPQSVIDGMLKSNGRVFLLNPSGVVIGAGARIDVAGFVASSLNMSDDDFLGGKLRFTENAAAKAVKNFGEITTAKGGHVYLVAPEVENHGIIRAPGGQIVLAAGKSAELVSDASPFVTVKVVADIEKALNVGKLIADSGSIGMYGALVRHSGEAEASGAVVGPGGTIRFVATKDLTIDAGSRIAANGTSGGKVVLQAEGGTNLIGGTVEAKGSAGKGGEVQALGVRVGVVGNGIIDASGETGGGNVLVGGDYGGGNSAIQNAQRTYIGPDGVIRADAGANGDGGRVIVWADGDTRFYGSISARGGSQSGNGGFVETSGKEVLQAFGQVDVGAANGNGGTWLLDPTNIRIVSSSSPDDAYVTNDGNYHTFFENNAATDSAVSAGAIQNAMSMYGNVTIQATQDVHFETDLDTAHQGSLQVYGYGNINLNDKTITTHGDLLLKADSDGNGYGDITSSLSNQFQILTNGGSAVLDGKSVKVGGIDTTTTESFGSSGSVQITAANGIETGPVVTRGVVPNSLSGDVTMQTSNGAIVVHSYVDGEGRTVSIDTRGGRGDDFELGGYAGGNVNLRVVSGNGSANVSGLILTSGGSASAAVYGEGFSGGSAGNVTIANSDGMPISGGITVGGIEAYGGAGGSAVYGDGGDGGEGASVSLRTQGALTVGSIEVSGGAGGSSPDQGGEGGRGGFVTLNGSTISSNFVSARGGNGSSGGDGGEGGVLSIAATSTILIGALDVSGGDGGSTSNQFNAGGQGGDGGIITGGDGGEFSNDALIGSSVTVGTALARGGRGGDGAEGGQGGDGGQIGMEASAGNLTVGNVEVYGGNAGSSFTSCCSIGETGGSGGDIGLFSMGSVSTGFLKAGGGAGSNQLASGFSGSQGGDGGGVNIEADQDVTIGPAPVIGKAVAVIDVSGGVGGSSVDSSGGGGGGGGFVEVSVRNAKFNGVLQANGGAGGAGTMAGVGGGGGLLELFTFDSASQTPGTGILHFVNGGWDVTGGAGSSTGSDGTVFTFVTMPAPINVAKFIHVGPGDLADIPVEETGIFRFTSVSDPLAVPAVLQQVGLTQSQEATSGAGESSEEEDTEKEKTGSLGSCRPS